MSHFPVPEHVERSRFDDAIATKELGLSRPLRFMSPSERARCYHECVLPYTIALTRLMACEVQPRFVFSNGAILDIQPEGRTYTEAEQELVDLINAERKFWLGGLET